MVFGTAWLLRQIFLSGLSWTGSNTASSIIRTMPTVFTGRRIWRRAFACRCDRVRRRRWTRLAAVLCQHRHFNSQSNLAPADAELQSAAPRRRVAYCATGSRQVVPAAAIPMATRLFATSAPTRSCGRAGPQVAGAAPHLPPQPACASMASRYLVARASRPKPHMLPMLRVRRFRRRAA